MFEKAVDKKTILIFGASSGIGQQVAEQILVAGWKVYGAARSKATLQAMVEANTNFVAVPTDVSQKTDVVAAFATASQEGRLDAVIYTPGEYIENVPIAETTDEQWDRSQAVNSNGAFYVARASAQLFRSQGSGTLLMISSFGGLREMTRRMQVTYNFAKEGIVGMMLTADGEFDAYNARAYVICPGLVLTKMTANRLRRRPDEAKDGLSPAEAAANIVSVIQSPADYPETIYLLDKQGLRTDQVTLGYKAP